MRNSLISNGEPINMNPNSKINLVLILTAFLVILVSLLTALAFGQYNGTVGPVELELSLIPIWVEDVFVMWGDGLISDLELINAIKFLIQIGIIKV